MAYATAVSIGQGAGGEVYKAVDEETGRTAALKVFPRDSRQAARQQREAEAQARLSHPSICEIYEVGTMADGRPFIAMRHVDGEPLDVVAARLPLLDRVDLLREVADAVDCAHQAGLVHRDLKPNNILVEEQDDGELRPFVLDFGIVHVIGAATLTETGEVLGTPGYLSPEQARGARELDPRSDVFSLGIVLYQVLTGQLPFEAESVVASLLRVLEHEPPLAHGVDPRLPPELGHIAAKAMEKDPRRRYRDAGAMRRDLDRFLTSKVVTARPVGRLGRLVRRIESRPRISAAFAALALLAAAAAGLGVYERFEIQEQARDAASFTRRVGDLEAQLRFHQLLPAHDLSAPLEAFRGEVEDLAREVEDAEGLARGSGEHALGRGLLVLGRLDAALEHLERARRLAPEDPTVALDLGRALVQRSREELGRVDRLGDPEVRRQERQLLLEKVRREALGPLDQAARGTRLDRIRRELALALVALLEDRPVDVLAHADSLEAAAPWLFEGALLHADVLRRRALEAHASDETPEGPVATLELLEEERRFLLETIARARSAAVLHERLCENRLVTAQVALTTARQGEDWQRFYAEAEAACGEALRILPGSRQARALEAETAWRHALQLLRREGGEKARAQVAKAVELSRAALDADPEGVREHWNAGNALLAEARLARENGDDRREILERAASLLREGLERAPGAGFGWLSLGHVWVNHGQAAFEQGGDPTASYGRALDAYRRGLEGSNARRSRLLSGMCLAEIEIGYYGSQHRAAAVKVDGALERAIDHCRRALELSPDYQAALSNLGLAYWTLAEWRIARGLSPKEPAAAGREIYARLLEREPDHVAGRINLAGLVASEAAWELDRLAGSDSSDSESVTADLPRLLEVGWRAIEPLRQRFPFDSSIITLRLALYDAVALCRRPAAGVDESRRLDAAWRRTAVIFDGFEDAGVTEKYRLELGSELYRRRAECALARRDPARAAAAVRRGLELTRRGLVLDPDWRQVAAENERLEALAGAGGGS